MEWYESIQFRSGYQTWTKPIQPRCCDQTSSNCTATKPSETRCQTLIKKPAETRYQSLNEWHEACLQCRPVCRTWTKAVQTRNWTTYTKSVQTRHHMWSDTSHNQLRPDSKHRMTLTWVKKSNLNLTSTLWTSLSGTFLQTLTELVTPLKGHSLSLHSCPPMLSVHALRVVWVLIKLWKQHIASKHANEHEVHLPWVKKKRRVLSWSKWFWFYLCKQCWWL